MRKKLFIFIAAMAALLGCKNQSTTFAELGSKPVKAGELYLVTPEGAVTSTGSQWVGAFKKGSENKLIVFFYGGGVSVDAFTAAHGSSRNGKMFFYVDDMSRWKATAYDAFKAGFGSDTTTNPFKDWSVALIPYTTGDFHVGAGEFEYTDLEGNLDTLYHHGYTNFKLFMDKVMPYVGSPEAIIVSGSSGGGFGASFLAEDVTEMFPNVQNFVTCIDASQLYFDKFPEVCRNVWQAPEHIANRFVSNNPVFDCLTTLHQDKPYVKILFTCSTRDVALIAFNNYFANGVLTLGTKEDGDVFQQQLQNFVTNFLAVDSAAGFFIWDDLIAVPAANLTVHTLEMSKDFHTDRAENGSVANWLNDAVDGNVRVVGLDCFQKQY